MQPNKENIDRWLSEWDVSSERKSQLLKKISDAYQQAGDPYVLRVLLLVARVDRRV